MRKRRVRRKNRFSPVIRVFWWRSWACVVEYSQWGIVRWGDVVTSREVPPRWSESDTKREVVQMALKRRAAASPEGAAAKILKDPQFAKLYPSLWDHLTQSAWDDGTKRETSSILIFASEGVLKAMLRDKDAGQCLWVASGTVAGLFAALEGGCTADDADWREDRGAKPVAGKSKK